VGGVPSEDLSIHHAVKSWLGGWEVVWKTCTSTRSQKNIDCSLEREQNQRNLQIYTVDIHGAELDLGIGSIRLK
jgi:hypothetical protein